jgi:hypothetical protein
MNNRRKSPRLSTISTPITTYKLPRLVTTAAKNYGDKIKTKTLSCSSNILAGKKSLKKRIKIYSKSKSISTRKSTRIQSKQLKIIKRPADTASVEAASTNSKNSSTSSRKRKITDDKPSNIKKSKYTSLTCRTAKNNKKNSRKYSYKSRPVKLMRRNNKANLSKNNHNNKIDGNKTDNSALNDNDKTNSTNSLLLANTSINLNSTDINVNNSSINTTSESSNTSFVNPSTSQSISDVDSNNHNISFNLLTVDELKNQLKKATIKFDKACRQLITLDQHMNDLQNSYCSSLENDRKTFKILYRMQLATLEGTHNAYIEYIERQVEKIKKIKRLLFNDNVNTSNNNDSNNDNSI